jgi:hypothetical protein
VARAIDHHRPADRPGRVPRSWSPRLEGTGRDEDGPAGHREVHRRPPPDGVTVVADAGMIAEANQKGIAATGRSFMLGMKIPDGPTR